MSRREFNQALAYQQIEPLDEGDNKRTAALMAHIANWSGRSLKGHKMLTSEDFLGKPDSKQSRQTADEQKAFLRSLKPKDK